MKQIKDIKRKLKWEEYYDPTFDWSYWEFYKDNTLTDEVVMPIFNKVIEDFELSYTRLNTDTLEHINEPKQ